MRFWQPYYKLTMKHDSGGKLIIESPRGTTLGHGIRIQFDVTATLGPVPNQAKINILGLDPETQNYWTVPRDPKRPQVGLHYIELEVGYKDFSGVIFTGSFYESKPVQKGTENWFTMELGQGLKSGNTKKHQNEPFVKKTKNSIVLFSMFDLMLPQTKAGRAAFESLKNEVETKMPTKNKAWLDEELSSGINITGNPTQNADRILNTKGLRLHHDQSGYRIIKLAAGEKNIAFSLGPNSGLIGTPEMEPVQVGYRCQLIPGLRVGQRVKISSQTYTGEVINRQVQFLGDWSKKGAWDCNVTSIKAIYGI